MAKGWREDKAWSDRFIPEIKRILGEAFFSLPTLEDDQLRNTDLICMDLSGKRIGCRVRRKEYLYRYPFEFTIRSSRQWGIKTELQKILEGWGDYFFYGFSNSIETTFLQWLIGDLQIFREIESIKRLGELQSNSDFSSDFLSFKWQDMPREFFVELSPIELLMTDVCEKCHIPKIKYGNNDLRFQCPKCETLYDYTIVFNTHRINRGKNTSK